MSTNPNPSWLKYGLVEGGSCVLSRALKTYAGTECLNPRSRLFREHGFDTQLQLKRYQLLYQIRSDAKRYQKKSSHVGLPKL